MSAGYIPASLQRQVRLRASERCEYCRIAQVSQEATFHVDHVMPRAVGGMTTLENLALACMSCSLRKAARTTVIDPDTGGARSVLAIDGHDARAPRTSTLQVISMKIGYDLALWRAFRGIEPPEERVS